MTPCASTQVIEEVPEDQSDIDPVGRPIPQITSHCLATGEAQFVDDMPRFQGNSLSVLLVSFVVGKVSSISNVII